MSHAASQSPAVHPDRLRAVASRLLTGVTIVTAISGPQKAVGCTANAVTSLSLDPPLMLICLRDDSAPLEAILQSGHFAINLLGGDDAGHDLCRRFAAPAADRFEGVEHRPAATGPPLLAAALGWFECSLHQTFSSGDHTICTGLVIDADAEAEGRLPLGFFDSRLFGVEAAA